MDKETLKNLLKENLKVETKACLNHNGWLSAPTWTVVTRILFDDEIISEDSIEIDSTNMTLNEVVEKIIDIVRKRGLEI